MTLDVPRGMIGVASPDAPILAKLQLACVGHSRRHRNDRQSLALRIESHHRVAACAAYPNLTRPAIDVYGIRNVVALTRQRIHPPPIILRVIAAKIAAAKTRYPHYSIIRHFQAARTMYRRLPFIDLARRWIDNSYSLAVELCVPNLAVRRDVDAVRSNTAGLAHRRNI